MPFMKNILQAVQPELYDNEPDTNETPPINIERIAIDNRGSVGSIYDGYEDNIKGKLGNEPKFQSYTLAKQIKCTLSHGCTYDSQNLLKLIDIDHNLRLSITLKLNPATGIASLIEDPRLVDKHTRLLYVYQESRVESCKDQLHQLRKPVTVSACERIGTHIITEVIYGIHLLIILKLPPVKEGDIDVILLKIQQSLSNNQNPIRMNAQDRNLLDRIISIQTYSNIDELPGIKKLEDIYERIGEMQKNDRLHRPLKYVLTPISWFYGQHMTHIPTLYLSKANEVETLENYLLQQSSKFSRLMLQDYHDLSESLQGRFQKQFRDIQNELSNLRVLQENDIERIRKIVSKIRCGKEQQSYLDRAVTLDPPAKIQQSIKIINNNIETLESKIKFIKQIQNDEFEYCDVAELGIREGLKHELVTDMLFGNDFHKTMIFATDELRDTDRETWTILYTRMIEDRKNNPHLGLLYADFTYSTYKLKKMETFLSRDLLVKNDNQIKSKLSEIDTRRKTSSPPPLLSPADDVINILLLGESGVGKSTFINAFANYLRFQSLEEAEQEKPVVVIPVSFVMTINENFDEHVIKFGETDENENHNKIGQSVTQQCKSYVFNISKEKKLRIIDTPGFGDTRGGDQDDLNMDEIFSFLNNFTYLNGVCLLFKPEVTQLNPYFRSCFTQLFDYFGPDIREHLMFCFTNARSTFFAPGNTRPLLQTFFNSFPVKDIPFKKMNTFCFDSESFRYLVAKQDSVEFDPNERDEFERSWKASVTESKRFRDFLCDQGLYRKNNQWQSTKDAQLQITFMIRPMLEAIRNLLRNVLLYNIHSSMKLNAKHVEQSSTICYTCNRDPQKFGQFWILVDHLHQPPNMCTSKDQQPAAYRLDFDFRKDQVNESIDDLRTQLRLLRETGAKFTCFLKKTGHTSQDDPFLNGIIRMIGDENLICQSRTTGDFNKRLIDQLEDLKARYEGHLKIIKSDSEELALSNIYELIKLVSEIPMVKIQLGAVRKYQQVVMDDNERVVHVNKTQSN